MANTTTDDCLSVEILSDLTRTFHFGRGIPIDVSILLHRALRVLPHCPVIVLHFLLLELVNLVLLILLRLVRHALLRAREAPLEAARRARRD